MQKRIPVEYYCCCSKCDEVVEIKGIRILVYGTANGIHFAHDSICCSNFTSNCPRNCSPVKEALRAWADELKVQRGNLPQVID